MLSPGEVPSVVPEGDGAWQQNLNIHMVCPECQEVPPNIVESYTDGDVVCGSCGLVLSNRLVDTRSEWRTFSNDDGKDVDPSRVGDGPNLLLNGDQLDTRIAASGNAKSRELQRAQGKTTADKATKGLMKAYEDISILCEKKGFTKLVSDSAKHIYKLIDDERALKGKSQDALIASCIFIACRQNNVARSFREITDLTRVPKKEIGRTFKTVEKFLINYNQKHKVQNTGGLVISNQGYRNTESSKAKDVCRRFCDQLRLKPNTSYVCEEVAERMSETGSLAGRSPLSIAAVCIYMCSAAMGVPKTPKEIGLVCGVSDGTIRSAYKGLYPEREQLIDAAWLESRGGDMSKLPPA
ncbi:cyclin-like protein [Rhizodiscina lignyota]|uniref:Transcription initiation factor IIB n=1 Tax=Rhizodiscina lignyota TaxID=1504668 RepID=A0A9P4I8S0_9PEZI|nr:cyclin-like protein [Rhizodiscina lignyota]